jgi:hypothetical protein
MIDWPKPFAAAAVEATDPRRQALLRRQQVGVDVVGMLVEPVPECGAVVLVQAGALQAFDEGVEVG